MQTGTIKWYNETKGFGFIVNDADSKDVFVHKSGLAEIQRPEPGIKVEFEISDGQKGPVAVNVKQV